MKKQGGLNARVMTITPAIAKFYLKSNVKNRPLRQRHVEKLANLMAAGKWVLNGEPIQFDTAGRLLNGQHRLNAVILSGVEVQMLVVFNVADPKAFETIDQNALSRGAHTVLQMNGVSNATIMTSISKKLLHWYSTKDKFTFSFNASAYKNVTSSDIVDYFEENQEDIQFIFESIREARILKTCAARSAFIAALVICFRANADIAPNFISMLKSGVGLQQDSPVLLLREKLTYSVPKEGGRLWDLEVMALTIKAFNAYSERKTRKLLRWSQNEKFPIPIQYEAC